MVHQEDKKSSNSSAGNSAKLKERIRNILNSQEQPTINVLTSLLALQDELHYLPPEAIEETAEFCSATINDVWSVAVFYTNFRLQPPGKYTLDICWGPTCHIKGAQDIINKALEELALTGEGESEDKQITLKYNTCLGACAHAPLIAVDHKLEGNASPESVLKRIRQLRNGATKDGDSDE